MKRIIHFFDGERVMEAETIGEQIAIAIFVREDALKKGYFKEGEKWGFAGLTEKTQRVIFINNGEKRRFDQTPYKIPDYEVKDGSKDSDFVITVK